MAEKRTGKGGGLIEYGKLRRIGEELNGKVTNRGPDPQDLTGHSGVQKPRGGKKKEENRDKTLMKKGRSLMPLRKTQTPAKRQSIFRGRGTAL